MMRGQDETSTSQVVRRKGSSHESPDQATNDKPILEGAPNEDMLLGRRGSLLGVLVLTKLVRGPPQG